MREVTNADRAERAYRSVQKYVAWDSGAAYSSEDAETHLQDMLCDLMHYADQYGIDFAHLVENAEHHHQCEVDEEETGIELLFEPIAREVEQ